MSKLQDKNGYYLAWGHGITVKVVHKPCKLPKAVKKAKAKELAKAVKKAVSRECK